MKSLVWSERMHLLFQKEKVSCRNVHYYFSFSLVFCQVVDVINPNTHWKLIHFFPASV